MKEVFKIRSANKVYYCYNWSCHISIAHMYDLIKAGHEITATNEKGEEYTREVLARVAKTCVKVKSKENLYSLIRSE